MYMYTGYEIINYFCCGSRLVCDGYQASFSLFEVTSFVSKLKRMEIE